MSTFLFFFLPCCTFYLCPFKLCYWIFDFWRFVCYISFTIVYVSRSFVHGYVVEWESINQCNLVFLEKFACSNCGWYKIIKALWWNAFVKNVYWRIKLIIFKTIFYYVFCIYKALKPNYRSNYYCTDLDNIFLKIILAS